jgi:uncharacterized membrane protein YhaH (DUF805 family)
MIPISRKIFVPVFLAIVVLLVGFDVVATAMHAHLPALIGWLWPFPLLIVVFLCAGRLKDAGRNPWWAVLAIFPVFALIGGAVLCFLPSGPALRRP